MTVLIALAVLVAILRPIPLLVHGLCMGIRVDPYFFMDNKHYQQSYQAVAHILVGILGTLWYYKVVPAKEVFIVLTVIEIVCAVWTVVQRRKK